MKRTFLALLISLSAIPALAQPNIKAKKYPSLLWEISGRGLKKPSYLIGTMHVSSKMAFNLPDSFYIAVRNAQVVALETNPETWQEDMSKYDLGGDDYQTSLYRNYSSTPNEYLRISTLRFYKYNTKIEHALYSNPSTINNLLYRTYGNESSDFEEDTYLDMYIYQCGKKWGKRVAGVENYGESMRLMAEAYKDAANDMDRKERSYGDADGDYSADKLQEAYRSGNLDLLDSINRYNSFSGAFDEKFLYRRNQIQAGSIDSILQSGATLFVGVGAAHLPGDRGVIELLRKKGYTLRPVKMGERASRQKDMVDKIRVPVTFRTESAEDGLYLVDIPGKFYRFGDDGSLEQKQYADMANGSYYMVTRIMTNAWMWAHTPEQVYREVDSLLYENVPGKIISKMPITKNGYKGFDIINRTRRGDLQRYNIFITPFEVIFFKMSGNGDYVKEGDEANRFFGSIVLKEYRNPETGGWKKYSPAYGGFAIDLPHDPYVGNDGSWIFDAEDKTTGSHYRVIRTDIHNYHFAEEDSFDLALMNESFMASEFIDTQLVRHQTRFKGYPALDGKYRDKSGAVYLSRFIIQGPHYYTLLAYGKQEVAQMQQFLNSFEIKPIQYGSNSNYTDTALYFSVSTPVKPESGKIKLNIPTYNIPTGDDDEQNSENELLEMGTYRNKVISNDTTGEKVYITFYKSPRYFHMDDSTRQAYEKTFNYMGDTTWMIRMKKTTLVPGKMRVREAIISDSGSSRAIWLKSFYRDGIGFSLTTEIDTLSQPSAFIKTFFETFEPADTLKGMNPNEKKAALFFSDLMSTDSVVRRRAIRNVTQVDLDSADLPALKKAISLQSWNDKHYLDNKKALINKFSSIRTRDAADYLKDLYYALVDTIQLQYPVLENLLQQKTAYSYRVFRDIVNSDPPVLETGTRDYVGIDYSLYNPYRGFSYSNGDFTDDINDSMQLARTILPDLLPLLNLEDYKKSMMSLIGQLLDSNLVKPSDYQSYFSKLMIEARQELKRQAISEKRKAIEKAEESKQDKKSAFSNDTDNDNGNDDLSLYARLLLPFWNNEPAVQPVMQQMLKSGDKKLRYNTLIMLMRDNKPFPDSMLSYFAGMDDYRYDLYTDLEKMGKLEKFPAAFNNHVDLGRSQLLEMQTYNRPDSVIYMDRLPATQGSRKGFIYFYKYKLKKDDVAWKIATVGLLPENDREYRFKEEKREVSGTGWNQVQDPYDFTSLSSTKLDAEMTSGQQLQLELRKLLYSKRKSAKRFYDDAGMSNDEGDYED